MIKQTYRSMISDKAKDCVGSATLILSEKAKKMKENGDTIISFGTGEPDFFTPDYICKGGKKAIDERKTKYDEVSGLLALRQGLSRKLREENGLEYSPDNIMVSSGAKASLSIALQTILNPGDEVILPIPYWVSYYDMIRLAGGVPIVVETKLENAFKITPAELIYAISPRTKAIIINTPVNPTGAVYSLAELIDLSEIITRNKIITIADEIYEEFVYDNHRHISVASLNSEIKDLTILINGFSKTYAMTGWRLGYAAANNEIIEGMKKLQGHLISHPSTISQHAGVVALNDKGNTIKEIIEVFDERRHLMMDLLNQIPGIEYLYPQGAFYIFVNIEVILTKRKNILNPDTSYGFAMKLLEKEKVVVIPGEAFGTPDFIRLSFATNLDDITLGMKKIKDFIQNY
ncbi:MAG: pyridoxal phosphate-dependent aminotransferase [Eubacteriaceae bacterium]